MTSYTAFRLGKETVEVTHRSAFRHWEVLSLTYKGGWTTRFIPTPKGSTWYSRSMARMSDAKHAEMFTFYWELPLFCLFSISLLCRVRSGPCNLHIFSPFGKQCTLLSSMPTVGIKLDKSQHLYRASEQDYYFFLKHIII